MWVGWRYSHFLSCLGLGLLACFEHVVGPWLCCRFKENEDAAFFITTLQPRRLHLVYVGIAQDETSLEAPRLWNHASYPAYCIGSHASIYCTYMLVFLLLLIRGKTLDKLGPNASWLLCDADSISDDPIIMSGHWLDMPYTKNVICCHQVVNHVEFSATVCGNHPSGPFLQLMES